MQFSVRESKRESKSRGILPKSTGVLTGISYKLVLYTEFSSEENDDLSGVQVI